MKYQRISRVEIIDDETNYYDLSVPETNNYCLANGMVVHNTGFGYSVQHHHIESLPSIIGPSDKQRRFLVGDSIEGWADAIKVLVKAYTNGKSNPVFDYRDIRPKGAMLITAGGKAPGPDPLRICVEQLRGILHNAIGRKLTSLECHSMMCHIADAVLSGGIRRAAMISFFSHDDLDMISCKSGTWWELNPQFGRANNSAVLVRDVIDLDAFADLMTRIVESGAGEPGVYFTNDRNVLSNPCVEATLRPHSFCVSGDTRLITKTGITTIKNSVGIPIEIWNGQEWATVTPYQTGDADQLYRVHFLDGSYLDATANHRFIIQRKITYPFIEMNTLELLKIQNSAKYTLFLPPPNIVYNEGGINEPNAYDYGVILGNRVNPTRNMTTKLPITYTKIDDITHLDSTLYSILKNGNYIPNEIFSWDISSILDFLAGVADGNGWATQHGYRIYGCESHVRDLQLLITKCGKLSYIKPRVSGLRIYKSQFTSDEWLLKIPVITLPVRRKYNIGQEYSTVRAQHQCVSHIELLPGTHASYCVTEPNLHQCVFNTVLTKQCNLTELNVSDLHDQEEFEARAKAATFIGTLQASYTDFHYIRPCWKKTTDEDALLGVSMTGIASGGVMRLDQARAAQVVVEENARVAALLHINTAARTTLTKPSGTASLVLGSSSGIHAWHDEYYIRRIRIGKNESLYQYLRQVVPELVEDCYFKPHLEAVLSVPQKAPDGAILRSESAIDLLERVLYVNKNWIRTGHQRGVQPHNVSCTISVKPEEWLDVAAWMWENRNNYNGISLFPYSDHTYVQAPFESCSKDTYDKLLALLRTIDINEVLEIEDHTSHAAEAACGGNGCEL